MSLSSTEDGDLTQVPALVTLSDPQKKTYADRITADWSQWSHEPSEAEIMTASLLASEGYLTSVKLLDI